MKLPAIFNSLPIFAAIALIVAAFNGNSENANITNAKVNNGNLGERIIDNILPTNEPNSIYGRVVPDSVYDGDTIRIVNRDNGEEIKIRFCGIDAPEMKQPGGIEARDYLRSLLPDNADVVIVPIEPDRYGRLVADIFNDSVQGETYINGNMVLNGYAWHYERYSANCSDRQALITAETLAKQNNLGVYADPNAKKPWDWRKQK